MASEMAETWMQNDGGRYAFRTVIKNLVHSERLALCIALRKKVELSKCASRCFDALTEKVTKIKKLVSMRTVL